MIRNKVGALSWKIMGICNLVLPCVRGRFNYSCVADQYVSLKSVDGRQDALGLRVLWVQNPVLTLTSPMAPNSRVLSKERPGGCHLVDPHSAVLSR